MRRRSGLALIAAGVVALTFGGRATPTAAPGFIGAFPWNMDDARFGGLSAIHVADRGDSFVAVTDQAILVTGTLVRDGDGRITAVAGVTLQPLHGNDDAPLRPARSDAEGIAVGPDGAVHVSFEDTGAVRVARYARPDDPPDNLPRPPAFDDFGINAGLEALAIAADGTLYTLPEVPDAPGVFPVWRFRGGAWDQPFALPSEGGFRAVAADIGPDGAFYLLERDFVGLSGFATRLRRFRFSGARPGPGRTLIETEPGQHDNLEGLSVWRGPGGLVATMVSDDNFRFFQETEIVEYRLPD